MLAVVKKPHTEQTLFEVKGEIPSRVLNFLEEAFGQDVEVIEEDTEDTVEAIDSELLEDFTDLRGTKEVTIKMKYISFDIPKIIINIGTTVTWVNLEDAGHYINSDPHPGHNYYPEQNSSLLSKGDSYSLTFDMQGIYPYHCSAHYSTMQGMILVK